MPAAGAYPVASLVDGRVRWSDGSITGSMGTPQGYVSSSRVPNTYINDRNFQIPKGSSLDTRGGGNQGGGGDRGGGSSGSSASSGGGSSFDILKYLQDQKNEGMRQLEAIRNSRLAELDSARRALGKKREQFRPQYEDDLGTVNQEFGNQREALQNSSKGFLGSLANRLSAQGIGGSYAQDKLSEAERAMQGQNSVLYDERKREFSGAKRAFDDRNIWADEQEAALQRARDAANEQYQIGANTGLQQFGGVLGTLLTQLQQQRAANEAAMGNINALNINPYGISFSSGLGDQLSNALSGMGLTTGVGNQQQTNAGNSLEGLSALQLEMRRRGLLA